MFGSSPQRRPNAQRMCTPCNATNKIADAGWEGIAGSVGIGVLWAALAGDQQLCSPLQVQVLLRIAMSSFAVDSIS